MSSAGVEWVNRLIQVAPLFSFPFPFPSPRLPLLVIIIVIMVYELILHSTIYRP